MELIYNLIKIKITLFFLIAIPFCALAQSPEALAKYHFIEAQSAYGNGDNSAALTNLQSCVDVLIKTNSKIEALYTYIYLSDKDYLKAKKHMTLYFDIASEDHSDYMKMISLLAETTSKAKEMQQRENIAKTNQEANEKSGVFTIVEKSAQFKGGMGEFVRWLQANLTYPDEARKMGVMGKVFVQFVVNSDGSVSDVKVIKGIGLGCNEEALRIMNMCPDWIPAQQRGIAVRQMLVIPITFNLQ